MGGEALEVAVPELEKVGVNKGAKRGENAECSSMAIQQLGQKSCMHVPGIGYLVWSS